MQTPEWGTEREEGVREDHLQGAPVVLPANGWDFPWEAPLLPLLVHGNTPSPKVST